MNARLQSPFPRSCSLSFCQQNPHKNPEKSIFLAILQDTLAEEEELLLRVSDSSLERVSLSKWAGDDVWKLRSSEHTWRLLLPCVPSSQGRARLWQGSQPGDSRLWHPLLLQAWLRSRARLAERTCLERRPWQRRKGDISCEGCSASPAGPAGSPTARQLSQEGSS